MLQKLKKSYWAKSGFFTISERLVAMLMGLGAVMMLTRYMTKEDFGIWVLFLTVTSILEVGRVGLLSNGLIKFVSEHEVLDKNEEVPKIQTASWVLNALVTGVIVLVLYGTSYAIGKLYASNELTNILQIYCFTTVALIPYFQCNFTQQANLDFKGVFFATTVKQGVLFAFVAVVFITKTELLLTDLAIWQGIGSAAASVVSWLFTRKYLQFSSSIHWKWVKKLFDYGKFVFGTNMSTMLYKGIDKLMLGKLAAVAATALYETAIRVTNMADVPTLAMANILFPQSARKAKEGKQAMKFLYENAVGAILTIMIPAILFVQVFAEFIITFIAGAKYLDGANLLRLTILYGFFMPFTVQFGTIMDAAKSPKINFRFTLLSMVLNVILNYIFITQMGVYGAAIGTLTTYSIIFVMIQVILKKEFDVNFLNCFKNMFQFYKKGIGMIKNGRFSFS